MRVEHVAASARGPLHADLDVRNEDAWRVCTSTAGVVLAVADGLGSKPHAAIGAHAACAAAVAAMQFWWDADASPRALPPLIEALWRRGLGAVAPNDARSTCLVAGISHAGQLVMATLGDGVALITSDRETEEADVISAERTGWSNETHALGAASAAGAWHVTSRPAVPGTIVLLASDGVADDLVPARRAGLARALVTSYGELADWRRSVELWRALQAWPTPGHGDDKTLALLWRPR
jgi:serine/threonine protein phosphatase PrpC